MQAHLLIIDGLLLTRCTNSTPTPATLHDMAQCVQLAQPPRPSKALVGTVDMNCSLVQHSRLKHSMTKIPFSTVGAKRHEIQQSTASHLFPVFQLSCRWVSPTIMGLGVPDVDNPTP
jgi:hypothetical protein